MPPLFVGSESESIGLGLSITPVPPLNTELNTLDIALNFTESTELDANNTINKASKRVKISE